MRDVHPLDIAIVAAYFGVLLFLGRRAARSVSGEESFFLAGRRLSKTYQFFLNFGNAIDANTAVSTVSLVYRQGIAGVWLALHMIFINPYYWFMSTWFRRARLITMADLFEDRFGSRGLARMYALFQASVGVVLIGFSHFTAYKICTAFVPNLPALPFYLAYAGAVGAYVAMGGMTATALSEAFQGVLVVGFSIVLIPAGLSQMGGLAALRSRVAPTAFNLFGSTGDAQFTWYSVLAILFVSVIQINANISNMPVHGSARDELTCRFGAVSGTYGKRLMIIVWGMVGLIALGLYRGPEKLADPDAAWGLMSRQLFGTGVLGLMLASTSAAATSAIAVKTLAVSALFSRNIFGARGAPGGDARGAFYGRVGVAAVLATSVGAALAMENVVEVMKFILTINLSFGAAVLLIFFWRRVTSTAVWMCVGLCLVAMVGIPYGAQYGPLARSQPSYFEFQLPGGPGGQTGASVGRGRFNLEAWLLSKTGRDWSRAPAGGRLAVQFLLDGLFPFAVLLSVSLVTRPPKPERVAAFFGKLRTPVGSSPELEAAAVRATARDPARFDTMKLFPGSSWEFTRWDRTDAAGFVTCCGITAAIVLLFWLGLRLLA